ncbi:MAG: alpha/beta hydrolase [Corynebacterium nuruki]|nr:alpha/beta hydrolase [Corynebacterium nuruki]
MAANVKKLLPRLGRPGPYDVSTGDLGVTGLPGTLFTPVGVKDAPAVAFGHDWRTGADAYRSTYRHLASWGIAVAAPDTETGFTPDHRGLAADLGSCLQILAGVRLGTGATTVDPDRLFLAGHGMGAGAAVLAAAGRPVAPRQTTKRRSARDRRRTGGPVTPTLAGVIAVFPSDTTPSCCDVARELDVPALVVAPGKAGPLDAGSADRIAASWRGPVVYRSVTKASAAGFSENLGHKFALGAGLEQGAQALVRALTVGFVLGTDDDSYAAFRDPEAAVKGTTTRTRGELLAALPEFADPVEKLQDALLHR